MRIKTDELCDKFALYYNKLYNCVDYIEEDDIDQIDYKPFGGIALSDRSSIAIINSFLNYLKSLLANLEVGDVIELTNFGRFKKFERHVNTTNLGKGKGVHGYIDAIRFTPADDLKFRVRNGI